MTSKITQLQQRRLQTVYSQWAKRFLFESDTREIRLAEMSTRAKRHLASANDLSSREAKLLIDSFQAELGIAETVPVVRTRYAAEKAGTEGRHDQIHNESTLVSPRDIARIQREIARLGWDQARLEAFLASPKGPNGQRTAIRTLGDANRAYWALKRMGTVRRGGKAHPAPTQRKEQLAAS